MANTLVILSNGEKVAVEDLTGEEMLLVWDMEIGQFSYAPIIFVDNDPEREYEIIKLVFSDNTEVKIIDEHGFFDMTIGRYVYINKTNANVYLGHYFNKQVCDINDNLIYESVQLVNIIISTEITKAYSPVTYKHLCIYVNGMLSMPGGIDGLFNIFEVDVNVMKYNTQLMNEDITTYGVFTYNEFNLLIPVQEEIFNAFNGQYLKVAIGKGLITMLIIEELLDHYSYLLYEV